VPQCSLCDHYCLRFLCALRTICRETQIPRSRNMREIVSVQGGQCGNQIGSKFLGSNCR